MLGFGVRNGQSTRNKVVALRSLNSFLLLSSFLVSLQCTAVEATDCMPGPTFSHVTLIGGLRAGEFYKVGMVTDSHACAALCCKSPKCDVAFMAGKMCYNVKCYSANLCQTRAARESRGTVTVTYVRRDISNATTLDRPLAQADLQIYQGIGNASAQNGINNAHMQTNNTLAQSSLSAFGRNSMLNVTAPRTSSSLSQNIWSDKNNSRNSSKVLELAVKEMMDGRMEQISLRKPTAVSYDNKWTNTSSTEGQTKNMSSIGNAFHSQAMPLSPQPKMGNSTLANDLKWRNNESASTRKSTLPNTDDENIVDGTINVTSSPNNGTKILMQNNNTWIAPTPRTLSYETPETFQDRTIANLTENASINSTNQRAMFVTDNQVPLKGAVDQNKTILEIPFTGRTKYNTSVLPKQKTLLQDEILDNSLISPNEESGLTLNGPGSVATNKVWNRGNGTARMSEEGGTALDLNTPITSPDLSNRLGSITLHPGRNLTTVTGTSMTTGNLHLSATDRHGGKCRASAILFNKTLVNGLKAGDFTDYGKVKDMATCVKFCCLDDSCDMSLVLSSTCYTLHCNDMSSCRVRPAHASVLNPRITFVTRNKRVLPKTTPRAKTALPVRTTRQVKTTSQAKTTQVKTTPVTMTTKRVQTSQVKTSPGTMTTKRVQTSQVKTTPVTMATKRVRAPSCKHGAIKYDVTLSEGQKAGIFRLRPRAIDIVSCVDECCKRSTCNVAFLIDKSCYSVQCYSKEDCKVIKARATGAKSQLSIVRNKIAPNTDKRTEIPQAESKYTTVLNITNRVFSTPLGDFESLEFLNLAERIQTALSTALGSYTEYRQSEVISFSPSPLLSKVILTLTKQAPIKKILTSLVEAVAARKMTSSIDGDDMTFELSSDGFKFMTPKGFNLVCDPEHDYDVDWRLTVFNEQTTHECPRKAQGFVKRGCHGSENHNATWGYPNFSNCKTTTYKTLHDQAKAFAEGAKQKTPFDTLRSAQGTTPSEILIELQKLTFKDTYRASLDYTHNYTANGTNSTFPSNGTTQDNVTYNIRHNHHNIHKPARILKHGYKTHRLVHKPTISASVKPVYHSTVPSDDNLLSNLVHQLHPQESVSRAYPRVRIPKPKGFLRARIPKPVMKILPKAPSANRAKIPARPVSPRYQTKRPQAPSIRRPVVRPAQRPRPGVIDSRPGSTRVNKIVPAPQPNRLQGKGIVSPRQRLPPGKQQSYAANRRYNIPAASMGRVPSATGVRVPGMSPASAPGVSNPYASRTSFYKPQSPYLGYANNRLTNPRVPSLTTNQAHWGGNQMPQLGQPAWAANRAWSSAANRAWPGMQRSPYNARPAGYGHPYGPLMQKPNSAYGIGRRRRDIQPVARAVDQSKTSKKGVKRSRRSAEEEVTRNKRQGGNLVWFNNYNRYSNQRQPMVPNQMYHPGPGTTYQEPMLSNVQTSYDPQLPLTGSSPGTYNIHYGLPTPDYRTQILPYGTQEPHTQGPYTASPTEVPSVQPRTDKLPSQQTTMDTLVTLPFGTVAPHVQPSHGSERNTGLVDLDTINSLKAPVENIAQPTPDVKGLESLNDLLTPPTSTTAKPSIKPTNKIPTSLPPVENIDEPAPQVKGLESLKDLLALPTSTTGKPTKKSTNKIQTPLPPVENIDQPAPQIKGLESLNDLIAPPTSTTGKPTIKTTKNIDIPLPLEENNQDKTEPTTKPSTTNSPLTTPPFGLLDQLSKTFSYLTPVENLHKNKSLSGTNINETLNDDIQEIHQAPMFGGDLALTADIMHYLTEYNKYTQSPQTRGTIKQFLQVGSHILDKKNKYEWKHITKETKGATSALNVARTVEDYSAAVSDKLHPKDMKKPLLTTNIMVALQSVDLMKMDPSEDISFPNYSDPYIANWTTKSNTLFVSPSAMLAAAQGESTQKIQLICTQVRKLSDLLPTTLVTKTRGNNSRMSSEAMSVVTRPPLDDPINPPIKIVLTHVNKNIGRFEQKCVFWKKGSTPGSGWWSSKGCKTVESSLAKTTCECSHMSTYAVIADTSKVKRELPFTIQPLATIAPPTDEESNILYILLALLALLIIVFIILAVVFFIWRKRKRQRQGNSSTSGKGKGDPQKKEGSKKDEESFSSTGSAEFDEMLASRRKNVHPEEHDRPSSSSPRWQRMRKNAENSDDLLMKEKSILMSDYHQPYHFSAEKDDKGGKKKSKSKPKRSKDEAHSEGSQGTEEAAAKSSKDSRHLSSS